MALSPPLFHLLHYLPVLPSSLLFPFDISRSFTNPLPPPPLALFYSVSACRTFSRLSLAVAAVLLNQPYSLSDPNPYYGENPYTDWLHFSAPSSPTLALLLTLLLSPISVCLTFLPMLTETNRDLWKLTFFMHNPYLFLFLSLLHTCLHYSTAISFSRIHGWLFNLISPLSPHPHPPTSQSELTSSRRRSRT